MVLGLPTLIADNNVDIEMPLDCYLEDLNSTELQYPLPGDVTPVFFFNHYVNLMKILSSVLSKLYTTKDRHGGVEKIAQLDRDLQMWNHSFNGHPNVIPFEIGHAESVDAIQSSENYSEADGLIMYWLRLLANLISVLIHRPGLTFDSMTKEFSKCLDVCKQSSTALLGLMDRSVLPKALQTMSLLGPNYVFQSALMHVYHYCISSSMSGDNRRETGPVIEAIEKAVTILRGNMEKETRRRNGNSSPNFYIETITSSANTLEAFVPSLEELRQNIEHISFDVLPQGSSLGTGSSAGLEFFNDLDQNMLDSLDPLEYGNPLEWVASTTPSFPNSEMLR